MARGDMRPVLKGAVGAAGQVRPIRARSARPRNLVLVDSASILEAGEVARLASQTDAVVLVARARATSKQALSATAEQVRRVGGTVLGVVLIGLRSIAESGTIDETRIPVIAQPDRNTGVGGGD
jgi:Mrp family chromosome partitioning ATPase